MGSGQCRVGCQETTNVDYSLSVLFRGEEYGLTVCGMWRHYAVGHGFQPTERERLVVMNCSPLETHLETHRPDEVKPAPFQDRYEYPPRRQVLLDILNRMNERNVPVMFVERTGMGVYSHRMGRPDLEWVGQLEGLLVNAERVSYKSV